MNDQGVFVATDGSKYIGEFKEGLRHGDGILKIVATGDLYNGPFEGDKSNGRGALKLANGDEYYGDF